MTSDPHNDLLGMYAQFLDARGYRATKIPETSTKTPDLAVTANGVTYLNEFKAPDLRLDDELGLYKFTTTNSKLLQFVNTAIKQLRAHDADHEKPWIVTFASTNFQLHWQSLFDSMRGGSVVEGKPIADWTKTTAFKRWVGNRYTVDLYVWLQVGPETKPYQASYFTNDRSHHRPQIDRLVSDLRSAPLSDADTNWLLV